MCVFLRNLLKVFMPTLFIFTLTFIACDDESKALILDELDEEYELYDYYIDQHGNEGIVAYKLGSNSSSYPKGYKYLIVLSTDEDFLPWGPMNECVMKKDTFLNYELNQEELGIGMLQNMCSGGINRYPAQKWCFQKNHKSDIYTGSWRLPSYYELYKIFGSKGMNVSKLNKALHSVGGTILDNDNFYWTSTEDFENYITINGEVTDYDQANRAVIASPSMTTTSVKDRWIKKNKYKVRAIKYIYYYDY